MLSDEEFVTQSMMLNLFYLANIRGFCLNITLSFLDKEYIKKAKEFSLRCEDIVNTFIDESIGIIPKFAIDNNFLVTKYTLDCEYLTEKLFNIDLDTSITQKLLLLKTAPPKKIKPELVELMMSVNQKTYNIAIEFTNFIKNIFELEKNNELFSYATPDLIKDIIIAIQMYLYMLERNIKKLLVNPTFISNYEYRLNNIMKNIAIYIASVVNPDREDIYIKSISFSLEFHYLNKLYFKEDLNPKSQKNLTTKTKKLMFRFCRFFNDIITDILNKKVYFIVEPVFIDDFYRGANYFIYNLTLIEAQNN